MAIERARPLLGTIVRIRCDAISRHEANRRIDRGFKAVAHVQRLMSFHEAGSDVSRLNRDAVRHIVEVHPDTIAVLRHALALSRISDGLFDISIGDRMVALRTLPRPDSPYPPDPLASWRDIEIVGSHGVRFHRPCWIDLGGIAKGYAVDRAIEAASQEAGDLIACTDGAPLNVHVNAGGDLRVMGPEAVRVVIETGGPPDDPVPIVDLENSAMATSGTLSSPALDRAAHVHGRTGQHVGSGVCVTILARHCVIADALSKVVLAGLGQVHDILARYEATAFLYRPAKGWIRLGAGS